MAKLNPFLQTGVHSTPVALAWHAKLPLLGTCWSEQACSGYIENCCFSVVMLTLIASAMNNAVDIKKLTKYDATTALKNYLLVRMNK